MDSGDFDELTKGVSKLTLNDAAVTVMPEMSAALGNGLKCGFLGLLHMEVCSAVVVVVCQQQRWLVKCFVLLLDSNRGGLLFRFWIDFLFVSR